MSDLLADLEWRGLLADCTDMAALRKRVAEGPLTLYCGFDPTGDSLHVGHLMGQLTLRRARNMGLTALRLSDTLDDLARAPAAACAGFRRL
ncbi:MAG TPA: tyrosine--tRNA ligase, partial [Lacunisphaera sp.]|nr:tyrosine--tRNA ligase [Lacunisphaera sp.]